MMSGLLRSGCELIGSFVDEVVFMRVGQEESRDGLLYFTGEIEAVSKTSQAESKDENHKNQSL